MRKIIVAPLLLIIFVYSFSYQSVSAADTKSTWWEFQSIDTMKYSRDLAREKLNNKEFDQVINQQVANIASAGASHVGIATPYDEEFFPFLKRWVDAARKNNLKVWFRGNFSGWEHWFNYPKISRAEHLGKVRDFIKKHPDIFENGDVFTSCPECENGGPGDPRMVGGVEDFRKFLIDEYQVTKQGFKDIGKDVKSNFFSVNFDVAKLIFNKDTTAKLDGVVTIDHYVKTPEKLISDIQYLSNYSGGRVVLGEFGAPIPDIHGQMSAEQQAEWLEKALYLLAQKRDIVLGLNYWLSVGGSTQIWDGKGNPKPAVSTLSHYYIPQKTLTIEVKSDIKTPVSQASINWLGRQYFTDSKGRVTISYPSQIATESSLLVDGVKAGFSQVAAFITPRDSLVPISLVKTKPNIFYRIYASLLKLLNL